MAYIPVEHQKYGVLPTCRENGGEVFSYSSELEIKIGELLPYGEGVIPYGYDSYEEFEKRLDGYTSKYSIDGDNLDQLGQLLADYKSDIKHRNVKENWSVLKYVGESTDGAFGLTHGSYYYWPCSIDNPEYEGVIDDEEFTSYLYPTDSHLWEIAEDPTGMAYRTLCGGENAVSTRQYMHTMEKIKRTFKTND